MVDDKVLKRLKTKESRIPVRKKQVLFKCDDKSHSELLVRLSYDSLTQQAFYYGMIIMYLAEDEDILKVVEKIKKTHKHSKRDTKKRQKDKRIAKKINDDFNLDEEEVDGMFDILEKEFPDL